jgi:4-diphosphocytidyl-2-C-methyl-D-erythritol kinase
MDKITVESPAKINLGLNIIAKREDGYHNLETIFIPILLSDKLTFIKSDVPSVETNSELLNKQQNNLVTKAINLLEEITGNTISVKIYIDKAIPIGGGLGGGSSDAATTLKTINKIFNLNLEREELIQIALKLGSDVPYFLNPVPAFAESRGEILHPLNAEIPYPILVVNPGINIETKWAFQKINPSIPVHSLQTMKSKELNDLDYLKENIKNDFEEIIFKEFPLTKEIKENLYKQGANFALMSGTGSTIFGIFSNLQKAYWAEEFFKRNYFTFLHDPIKIGSIT